MTAFTAPKWYHFLAVSALIISVSGFLTTDHEFPTYLQEIVQGRRLNIPADQGFLLEGLLEDAIGGLFTLVPIRKLPSTEVAWIFGMLCAASALIFSVWDRTITVGVAFLGIAFTRVVDTCFLWIGKLDPYLVTFLLLTINRNPWIATGAAALAAFCHPAAAILSTLGVNAVTYWIERRINRLQIAAVLMCGIADLVLFKFTFPSIRSRSDLFLHQLLFSLRDGVEYGLAGAAIGIVLPIVAALLIIRGSGARFDWRFAPTALWLAAAFVVSAMLALDHTRVATLIILAPYLLWLNLECRSKQPISIASQLFCALFLFRVFVPHVDMNGAEIFEYGSIERLFPSGR